MYIMDHAAVPCSSKTYNWPLNLSHDHFNLHIKNNNVRVSMELEVPERLIFHAYNIHCRGHTGFVARETKEVLLLQRPRDMAKNAVLIFLINVFKIITTFKRKKRDNKGRNFSFKIFFPYYPIWTHPSFGAWSTLFVHVQFTSSELHCLKSCIFQKN